MNICELSRAPVASVCTTYANKFTSTLLDIELKRSSSQRKETELKRQRMELLGYISEFLSHGAALAVDRDNVQEALHDYLNAADA